MNHNSNQENLIQENGENKGKPYSKNTINEIL